MPSLYFFSLFSLLWLCCVLFPLGFSPVTLSDSLQMDVVSAFQSGTSFQGALRRQASNSSQQQHDVTNVSSPTHVAFSTTTTTATAANTASATVGCECVFSSSAWDFFYFFCSSNIFLFHSSSHLTLTLLLSHASPNVPPCFLPKKKNPTRYTISSILLR